MTINKKESCYYCKKKLYIVYVREKGIFNNVKSYQYCKNCDKMFHTIKEVKRN